MAAERCPLCQSKLVKGECLSCGYRPPDEGDISALYNYDPTDYPQEQPVREIMPDVQMEEIYPNRPEMADINDENVVDNVKPYKSPTYYQGTPEKPFEFDENDPLLFRKVQQHRMQMQSKNKQDMNPYAGGNFTPYQTPSQKNINTNLPGSFLPNISPGQSKPEDINSCGEFIRKYWLYLLLSLIVPFLGLVLFAIFRDRPERKYCWMFLVLAIMRIIF
ncbi:MAG: hypothetical protein J1E40_06000 [Oscillospiraceae bacterium]|nr:hypothetical protein [Oscillospiraceae bacterium]